MVVIDLVDDITSLRLEVVDDLVKEHFVKAFESIIFNGDLLKIDRLYLFEVNAGAELFEFLRFRWKQSLLLFGFLNK